MPKPSDIFFHKRENFLKTDKYFEFIEKFSECLTKDEELCFILDKEELSQIDIPQLIKELAIETGQPINHLITMALRHLNLEWKYGNFYKNRNIIRLIRNCPEITPVAKSKLLGYIFNNINESELYQDE
jgi:hypothetical protein